MSSLRRLAPVQPEEVIDVGAQVAGQIKEFGVDGDGKGIDFGLRVAAGSVLALIDDSVYTAQVTRPGHRPHVLKRM